MVRVAWFEPEEYSDNPSPVVHPSIELVNYRREYVVYQFGGVRHYIYGWVEI